MKFFKLKTKATVENIINEFQEYEEYESHSILRPFFDRFYNSRIGIHTYTQENKIWGYYETGLRGRTGELNGVKTWFYLFLNEEQGETEIKGYIIQELFTCFAIAYLIISVIVDVLRGIKMGGIIALAFITLWCTFAFSALYNTEKTLYNDILNVIKKAEWETENKL
jgi:hypothetical protein